MAFDDTGVTILVKDFTCYIDTGTHPPIACHGLIYGPHETPIVEKAIHKLLSLKQIRQVFDGGWLSKGLLAPKPHQEGISDIENFVWRFCVNYIPLNSVTCIIAYPVPCCNKAVSISFGDSRWKWLMDTPSSYHQIKVDKASQHKLAFDGPMEQNTHTM